MALFPGDTVPDLHGRMGPDPLGVLGSCALVLEHAQQVWIDTTALDAFVDLLVESGTEVPEWDAGLHFRDHGPDGDERTAGWIFALDALNFCFWGQGDDPDRRWRVSWNGVTHNGYAALAATLSRAADSGTPIWDPVWLANVDRHVVSELLAPIPGADEIPLLDARVAHLRELGMGMMAIAGRGEHAPFSTFITRSGGSAVTLVCAIVATFASFDDVSRWTSPSVPHTIHDIRFYKRAQILVSDLAGSLGDTARASLGAFHDRHLLTAFADYKVPQVLRQLGILAYRADLADRIRRRVLIPAGSTSEIEIRAATIWACELIRQGLAATGRMMTASEVDWLLWNAGQNLPSGAEPYHRTITPFY